MSKAYFDEEFNNFFAGLALNNEKSWFDKNRKTYEDKVKKPWEEFLSDLINEIRKFDHINELPLNKFTFRINRDVRFSKDKTPYNPWVSAAIVRNGKKDQYPGYYLRLGVEGVSIGGGMHMPDKETLTTLRRHIAKNSNELRRQIKDKDFRKYFNGEIHGEKNKILPPEFKESVKNEPLIANKGWHYWNHYSADKITKPDFLTFISDHFKAGQKINSFLKEAL